MTERAVKRIRRSIRRSEPTPVTAHSTVINIQRADNNTSRQVDFIDEFETLVGLAGMFIPTPFDVPRLFEFISRSNMLGQCIEAYVTNTVGTGWEPGKARRDVEMDPDEKAELESFIDSANSDESLSTVMSHVIRDRESVGFGFLEVIRDRKGDVALLRHAKSLYTRLGTKHPQPVLVKYEVPRGARVAIVHEFKKFRRFLQVIAGRIVWFKEYGDPRNMNSVSGLFEGEAGYTDDSPATEILHIKNPSNDPYGVPRWISQLPSIIGSREAEEVNMRYFEDNTVPPMMLTVGGGRLTAQSYADLTRLLQTHGVGRERQNQIIIVEAVGEGDSIDGKGSTIQLKVERLTDQRPSDALFKDYDEANQAKVRSSFRLPSVAVGMANEHNFATANVAMFAAESQVFAPYRAEVDEILNNKFVKGRSGLRLRTARLVGRTPAITSPDGMMKSLTALNVMGALTPRIAQQTANAMLQIELPEYPKKGEEGYEDWMDRPITFATQGQNSDKSHAGQAQKTQGIKDTEANGGTNADQPKHGQE